MAVEWLNGWFLGFLIDLTSSILFSDPLIHLTKSTHNSSTPDISSPVQFLLRCFLSCNLWDVIFGWSIITINWFWISAESSCLINVLTIPTLLLRWSFLVVTIDKYNFLQLFSNNLLARLAISLNTTFGSLTSTSFTPMCNNISSLFTFLRAL